MTRILVAVTPVTLCTGCVGSAGSATLHMVPLSYTRLDAQAPLIVPVRAEECCFWIDEKQQIRIAMTDRHVPLLGENNRRTLDVSLVLDGVPANVARNYRATRRTLRGKLNRGNEHARFASIRGIAAVWLDSPDRIHGRFRISAKYQKFNILFGWHATRHVLLLGEFEAVRNRRRCQVILARTEQGGMEREPVEPQRPGPVRVTGPPVVPKPPPRKTPESKK